MARMSWVASIAAVALAASVAQAGIFEDLYRGLNFLSVPSGFPIQRLADGTIVNGQRAGLLRFVQNRPGRGWDLEFSRTFGNDTTGRPETLDLGPLELEMDGEIGATLGYTSRGFLVATGNITVSSLNYTLRSKLGAQDANLSGTLSVLNNFEVNQFGFYTVEINTRNINSSLTLDGVAVRDTENLSFDIGPIQIQGNIFFDALIAGLSAVGVDTTALQELTPRSPIDRIVQEIESQLRSTQIVTPTAQVKNAATRLLEDQAPFGPTVAPLTPAAVLTPGDSVVSGATVVSPLEPAVAAIPEPATLAALLLAWTLVRRPR